MSEKLPLVLLAGLLCDDEVWAEVAAQLDDVAQITTLSFPDHATIESMADKTLHVAPPQFAVAGHSLGGRVAIEIVRRAPERLLGIALLNTGIHPTAAHEQESRGRLVALAATEGMAALARAWLPPMLGRQYPPNDPMLLRLSRMVVANSAESYAAFTADPSANPGDAKTATTTWKAIADILNDAADKIEAALPTT